MASPVNTIWGESAAILDTMSNVDSLPVGPEDWQALNSARTRFAACGYEVVYSGQGVWHAANGGPGAPTLSRWHFVGIYAGEREMLAAATTALHRYRAG